MAWRADLLVLALGGGVATWARPAGPCRSGPAPARSVRTVDQDSVSATLAVAAPAARVFAVLADPATTLRSTVPAGFGKLSTGRR
jgi:hypothetical protein